MVAKRGKAFGMVTLFKFFAIFGYQHFTPFERNYEEVFTWPAFQNLLFLNDLRIELGQIGRSNANPFPPQ